MLKSLKVKIVEKRTTTASTGLSNGSVMYQKARHRSPRPSASAASYSSRGIDTSPARIVMAKNGSPRHTLTTTTRRHLHSTSARASWGRAAPSGLAQCSPIHHAVERVETSTTIRAWTAPSGSPTAAGTAPRISRLNQSCWLRSRASEIPNTSLPRHRSAREHERILEGLPEGVALPEIDEVLEADEVARAADEGVRDGK